MQFLHYGHKVYQVRGYGMTCSTNIVTANFGGGKREATTAPLYQWDYGQVLCIAGLDALPQTFEVHFATQKNGGVSTTVVGIDERVDVPNVLLTIGKDIHAWIYLSDTTGDGETEYAITIPVKARPMPEYYDAEDTGVFDAVVEQVADYAATATAAANSAGASATAAAGSASAAAQSAASIEGDVQIASQKASEAQTAAGQAVTAKEAAQTAQQGAEAAATNAGQSASTATAKAAEAATSASNAAQSKTDAEAAAARAEQAAASLTVDSALSDSSTNPVQNKVITAELTNVKSAIDDNGLNTNIATPPFVLGAITLTNQALVYSASTTSCVTAEGTKIVTEPGTIIRLTDKDNYKYRTWYTGNNTKWYSTSSSYTTSDTVISNARQYVVQIARQDGGTITANEVAGKIQFILPVSVGDLRDLGYYKTFALYDNLTLNGDLPQQYGGGTTSTTASMITPFIPVKAGQTIAYRLKSTARYYLFGVYNTSLIFVDGVIATGGEDTGTYTFASDGFIKVPVAATYTDAYLYFSNYNQADMEALLHKEMSADIATNASDINGMKASVSMLNTDINGMVDTSNIFEIGNITANTSGWTYGDSTKRIRTKEGVTLWLVPGDLISLTDYSNARFALGWRTSNGSYSGGSWHQEDFMVNQAGYYVMVVSNLPEVVLSSIDDLLSLVRIKKCVNLKAKAFTAKANVCGINHRGYNMIAPENTMPAFKLSKEMGFDWVETDICWTSDNVPVLLHDGTIDRTSNGTGNINDMTYAQVSEYDFGSWKGEEYTGTKIPTFEELLLYCKRSGMGAYLELKSYGSSETNVKACAEMVKKYGLADRVVWISFSDNQLSYVSDVIPEATLGYITSTINSTAIATAAALKNGVNTVIFDPERSQITDSNVSAIIAAGLKVGTYTADTMTNILGLNNAVEYITTNVANIPEMLFAYANK